MSNLMLSLPLSGSGLFSNGGGPGSTGLLSSNENLLTWLGESVIPVLFQDAVCGDGKCEAPEEEKGYGRFGWYVFHLQLTYLLKQWLRSNLPAKYRPHRSCNLEKLSQGMENGGGRWRSRRGK
jgi:hypothetical protein